MEGKLRGWHPAFHSTEPDEPSRRSVNLDVKVNLLNYAPYVELVLLTFLMFKKQNPSRRWGFAFQLGLTTQFIVVIGLSVVSQYVLHHAAHTTHTAHATHIRHRWFVFWDFSDHAVCGQNQTCN